MTESRQNTIELEAPANQDKLDALNIGDVVYINGRIYTGREGVYRRILDQGVSPPTDLSALSNVNFHCSPAAAIEPDGSYTVGAVTATASFRFSKWMQRWFELTDCKVVIGKGGMPQSDFRITLCQTVRCT